MAVWRQRSMLHALPLLLYCQMLLDLTEAVKSQEIMHEVFAQNGVWQWQVKIAYGYLANILLYALKRPLLTQLRKILCTSLLQKMDRVTCERYLLYKLSLLLLFGAGKNTEHGPSIFFSSVLYCLIISMIVYRKRLKKTQTCTFSALLVNVDIFQNASIDRLTFLVLKFCLNTYVSHWPIDWSRFQVSDFLTGLLLEKWEVCASLWVKTWADPK